MENQDPNTPKYNKVSGLLTDYGKSLGLKEVNPATNANLISSQNLSNTTSPMVLPRTTANTYADGFQEFLSSTNNSVKTEADQLRTQREETQQATKNDLGLTLKEILRTNTDIANVGNTIDRSGEDKAKKDADRYTSELEAEQLSNRRRIEKLQKENPEGLFGGGLEQEVNRINRDSVSKQADLAILQNSALRNYETANAIADRQLQLKLEPLKAKLENLKFFYSENKADFNREDDRLYNEAIKKADREYKKTEDIETKIKDLKMNVAQFAGSSAGGILAKLASIDTTKPDAYDQAVKIAGKFASDPLDRELKQANLSKLNADAAKTKAETDLLKTPGSGKPPTDIQIQNAGFAERISQANKIIDGKADTFANMGYKDFFLASSNSQLANKLLSPDVRQAAQAMRNFITAKLRKESGAAISQSEFDDARVQYFPAYGDDDQTLANKKELRDSVYNNLVQGSGSAYKVDPVDTYLDNSVVPTLNNKTQSATSYWLNLSEN